MILGERNPEHCSKLFKKDAQDKFLTEINAACDSIWHNKNIFKCASCGCSILKM